MSHDNILDVSQLSLVGDFDSQVGSILERIRLTREEVEGLQTLYRDLEEALQTHWEGCRVMPFGSIITGLGIKTSDADCYVAVPPETKSQSAARKCVLIAKKILHRYSRTFIDIFAITAAKVPIVQFTHVPTRRYCDVSFTSRAGARNSELICFLLQYDKRAMTLAILLKYWSKVHKLTGTNLVPNYALIMMIIFYLQQLRILPSVESLQNSGNQIDMVEGWNTGFDTSIKPIPPSDRETPLHRLMGEFFKFYRDFDFKHNIICPYLGRVVKRTQFQTLDAVPKEFSLYKSNVTSHQLPTIKVDSEVCVQDPFQHNRNCSMAIHARMAQTFKMFINLAASIFDNCGNNHSSLLFKLLTERPRNVPYIAPNVPAHIQQPAPLIPWHPGKVVKRARRGRFQGNMPHLWTIDRRRNAMPNWNHYQNMLQQRLDQPVVFRRFGGTS